VVAGGAGFIGTHLCRALLDRGDDVVCVDNLSSGTRDNADGLCQDGNFSFIETDISQDVPVEGPIDAVLNLASPASPTDFQRLSVEIMLAGSTGTKRLLDLAVRHQAVFFQASTSEVYGEPLVHPQPETYWGNVNPVGVRAVYDEAKRYSEALTMAYHRRFGLDVRIARIFNTYGPRMRSNDGRVVSNFICQALSGRPLTVHGDGSQTRSFAYVEDTVSGLLALLHSRYIGPVNIGNPHEFTVLELATKILGLTGSRSRIEFRPLPPDDPKVRRPDITLAAKELSWGPKIELDEGLTRTIPWFADELRVAGGHCRR
jgi:dTDP-glucose 4,6-dehydratase